MTEDLQVDCTICIMKRYTQGCESCINDFIFPFYLDGTL